MDEHLKLIDERIKELTEDLGKTKIGSQEYADKVKNEVSDRHLLMQAGNAMTVNVIKALGCSIKNFIESEVH